ncbi:hypothetical protein D3C71_1055060 [compost metagenome]
MGPVVAREPDFVHAIVQGKDPVGRHNGADVVDDPLRREAGFKLPVGDAREDPLPEIDQRFCVWKPALKPVRQELEGGPEIPDHLGLREIDLLDSGRLVPDMNGLRSVAIHHEGRLFDRVVSDRDDEIGPFDGLVDIVPLGKSGSTQIEVHAAWAKIPLKALQARIAELDQARVALKRLVGECASGRTGPCPILSSFGV